MITHHHIIDRKGVKIPINLEIIHTSFHITGFDGDCKTGVYMKGDTQAYILDIGIDDFILQVDEEERRLRG